MSTEELEPLASIAVAAEVAVQKIRDAWAPVLAAGVALAEHLRSDAST